MQIIYQDSKHLLTIEGAQKYFYNHQECTADEAVQILQLILESRDYSHVEKFDNISVDFDINSLRNPTTVC